MSANQPDYAEKIIATLVYLFKTDNQHQPLEVLIHSKPSISWSVEEVDLDWMVTQIDLYLYLPIEIFVKIRQDLTTLENEIKDKANLCLDRRNETVRHLQIVPELVASLNWRDEIHSLATSQFGIPPRESQYEADIFMLMPFEQPDLQEVYKDHIVKVAHACRLTIKRGDDFFTQQSIMQDIWGAINAAKLIIADCTGRNPNVFYELGIAHTLGKKTIVITREENDIPFDLRHLRYIKYDFTPRGMREFEKSLSDAISECLDPTRDSENSDNDIDGIPF